MIEKLLKQLAACIVEKRFDFIESDRIELKKGAGVHAKDKQYKALMETICAFLNADGGIILLGIWEDIANNRRYELTGFKAEQEDILRESIKTGLANRKGEKQSVFEFVKLEMREILGKPICVVYVEKLPEDQKYVFYEGTAYKRRLTADEKLTETEILAQEELKEEIKSAQELQLVPKAQLTDLDVNKLNEYITELNKGFKIETIKPDMEAALPFLIRKGFLRENVPTLLGMLVCGKHIFDFVRAKCEVDCYLNLPTDIAQDKQILKDNLLDLMSDSLKFVNKNIQVGVSYVNGGTAMPEYPARLIREVINNALAHRDYGEDRFVVIVITPNTSIEIRNPGAFRKEQVIDFEYPTSKTYIRKIVPIPKPRNPKLADILKTFDKWEGRGIGMASLTNACLANEINVPYYTFHSQNDISLFIQKGKVLDEEMEQWLLSFSRYFHEKKAGEALSETEKILLSYFYKSEKLNREGKYTILLTKDNNHSETISTLLEQGILLKWENSTNIHPVYLLDKELLKDNFKPELKNILGLEWDILKAESQEVLEAIYKHQKYSLHEPINPSYISSYLYAKKHKMVVISQLGKIESYTRKIRAIFTKLEEKQLIYRKPHSKNSFLVNDNYKRNPTLFEK